MAENEVSGLLRAGIAAARAGNRSEARRLLKQVLEQDDKNELAWMWMATVVDTIRERRHCLEAALDINPANARAQQELARLRQIEATQPKPASKPASSAPGQSPSADPSALPQDPLSTSMPDAQAASDLREALYTSPAKQSNRATTGVLISLAGLIVILLGIGALVAFPILNQGNTSSASTQTLLPGTSTLAFSAMQRTLDAQTGTPHAQTTIVTVLPNQVPQFAASWTPLPSFTPPPTSPPTATAYPVAQLTLSFSGEGRGRPKIGVYLAAGDGSGERLLVNSDQRVFDSAWSPDGKRIAFITDDEDGKEQLAVANGDGESPSIITHFTGTITRTPAWSPDGKQIAVVTNQDGKDSILLVNADGTGEKPLMAAPIGNNRDPAWSPDGKQLAYASDPTGRGFFQIYALDLATNKATQLTESQNSSYSPAWSPDGKRIAFTSTRDGHANLYVMPADGSDEQLLSFDDDNAENRDPTWSPDSRWIIFSSNRDGGIFKIFSMAPDGSQLQPITTQNNVSVGPRVRPGS